MKRRILVLVMVGLFAVSTLTGCSSSTKASNPNAPAATGIGTAPDGSEVAIEKAVVKFMNDAKAGGYQLVTTEELNNWIKEKKDMIIIDTMPADFFAKGHIPGAVNAELPKTTMNDVTDEQKAAFIKLLGDDQDKPIVVYCGFVGCARSDIGSVIALEQGFKNVYRVPGGISAWKEAGYELQK